MAKIISISVTDLHDLWLKKHKNDMTCSPTLLLRNAISQKMQENGDVLDDYRTLIKKNDVLKENLSKAVQLLQNDGTLFQEYCKECFRAE